MFYECFVVWRSPGGPNVCSGSAPEKGWEVRERSWGALVSSKATFGVSGGASGCFGDVSGRLLGAPVAPSEVSWGVWGASQGGF